MSRRMAATAALSDSIAPEESGCVAPAAASAAASVAGGAAFFDSALDSDGVAGSSGFDSEAALLSDSVSPAGLASASGWASSPGFVSVAAGFSAGASAVFAASACATTKAASAASRPAAATSMSAARGASEDDLPLASGCSDLPDSSAGCSAAGFSVAGGVSAGFSARVPRVRWTAVRSLVFRRRIAGWRVIFAPGVDERRAFGRGLLFGLRLFDQRHLAVRHLVRLQLAGEFFLQQLLDVLDVFVRSVDLELEVVLAHAADGHVGQVSDRGAHVGDLVRLVLVEQHLHARSASEVDVENLRPAHDRGHQPDGDDQHRAGDRRRCASE